MIASTRPAKLQSEKSTRAEIETGRKLKPGHEN
jgi:hypothetical protein